MVRGLLVVGTIGAIVYFSPTRDRQADGEASMKAVAEVAAKADRLATVAAGVHDLIGPEAGAAIARSLGPALARRAATAPAAPPHPPAEPASPDGAAKLRGPIERGS